MDAPHVALGVDATPAGWVAVRYEDTEYASVHRYRDDASAGDVVDVDVDADATADHHTDTTAFQRLWNDHSDADVVLVDVPIGLSETDAARRPEQAARDVLGPRAASVFNVPIRSILEAETYADANEAQRDAIDKGLMKQTYNVTHRIREVDEFLQSRPADDRQTVVRESHPEVCFWALHDGHPMAYSKTDQPAAAHWERVGVLATVHDDPDDFHDALADAGQALIDWHDPSLSNDDLLDAFALAVTGSDLTGPLRTLPEDPDTDATGLRMEMVYALPK